MNKTHSSSRIVSCLVAYACMLTLASCNWWQEKIIDEAYAASVVKEKLSIPGNVSTQKLKGGQSSAKLFLVDDGSKKYVVRFIQNEIPKAINSLQIASDGGYGPHVYFADTAQGIVIMEYLSGKQISDQDLQSDQFYIALAHLLQKIHSGKALEGHPYDVLKNNDHYIKKYLRIYKDHIPLEKVAHIATTLHKTLRPYVTASTPTHNDLHGGNLMFLGNEFKSIDFDDATLGEPYFDIATVATYYCFDHVHEKLLFTTYLEHQPSTQEMAKLYLMKQAVLIKWICDMLGRISPEIIHEHGLTKTSSSTYIEYCRIMKEYVEGKLDLSKRENHLKLLKALLNQLFDNIASQEFKNAVNIMNTGTLSRLR